MTNTKHIPLPKTKPVRCFICGEAVEKGQDYHAGRVKGEKAVQYVHADCFAKEGKA